jgi:hypothetical protein
MIVEADLLIHSAAQVVTCASDGPKRGAAMQDVGLISDGAVVVTFACASTATCSS